MNNSPTHINNKNSRSFGEKFLDFFRRPSNSNRSNQNGNANESDNEIFPQIQLLNDLKTKYKQFKLNFILKSYFKCF